jgi:hypothetical protein
MAELRTIELPEHLANMTEFRLLDEVSEKQISDFEDELEARHNDFLITTATVTGIARREKILKLVVDPTEDLEARRARVLFWWYNRMPYTRKVIEGRIAALCGAGNYTFEYDVENEILHVGVTLSLGWPVVDMVRSLLDELVMLNVILDVRGTEIDDITTSIYVGAAVSEYTNCAPLYDNA